jgi:hypothetical protein
MRLAIATSADPYLAAATVLLKENIEVNKAYVENRQPKGDFDENSH